MIICISSHDDIHIYSWWYTYLLMMIYISTHDDIISTHDDIHIYSWWYSYLLMMICIYAYDDMHKTNLTLKLGPYPLTTPKLIFIILEFYEYVETHIAYFNSDFYFFLLPLNVSTHYNIHVYSWWYTYLLMRIHTSTHNDIYITAQDNMHIWSW